MVLCLALHLIDPEVQVQLGYSTQETVDLAKQMFSAAQVSPNVSLADGRRELTELVCAGRAVGFGLPQLSYSRSPPVHRTDGCVSIRRR